MAAAALEHTGFTQGRMMPLALTYRALPALGTLMTSIPPIAQNFSDRAVENDLNKLWSLVSAGSDLRNPSTQKLEISSYKKFELRSRLIKRLLVTDIFSYCSQCHWYISLRTSTTWQQTTGGK